MMLPHITPRLCSLSLSRCLFRHASRKHADTILSSSCTLLSIRAVRLLQHNHRWAAKLAKQKARADAAAERRKARAEAAKAREAEQAARQKINPFAAAAAPNAAGGLGGMLFGVPAPEPTAEAIKPKEDAAEVSDEEDDDGSDSDEETSRLAEELAVKASLEATQRTADWASSSTYYEPALYLNTVPEPSASARRAANTKLTPAAKDAAKAASKDGVAGTVLDDDAGLKAWAGESYTKMMVSGVDETFERFVARVEPEARQVVRYEMGGTPLPFIASGPIFEQLWPKVKPTHVQATRPGHAPPTTGGGRSYDASQVPACPACGGKRTFEVQLMPNLVNLLKPTLIQGVEEADAAALPSTGSADDRRRREIERALGRKLPREPDADGITRPAPQQSDAEKEEEARAMQARTGLNFATALVYVCEKDCCVPREDGEANETWREEWVGLQWEE